MGLPGAIRGLELPCGIKYGGSHDYIVVGQKNKNTSVKRRPISIGTRKSGDRLWKCHKMNGSTTHLCSSSFIPNFQKDNNTCLSTGIAVEMYIFLPSLCT